MANSKADRWLTPEGLTLLERWARDGLIDEQIAHNMGVSVATLNNYKIKYLEILESLKKGKMVVDFEVENALLQKALSGDVTAMIFWLKNRKPDKWRDKPEPDTNDDVVNKVKEILVTVRRTAAKQTEVSDES